MPPRKRKIGSAYTAPEEAVYALPPKNTRLAAPVPAAAVDTPQGWQWEQAGPSTQPDPTPAPALDPEAQPEAPPDARDAASPSKRALDGWTTRRNNFAANWARLADLNSDVDTSLLPSDDLLHALHAHTAALYASHDLLAPTPTRTRKYTYLSRRKQALIAEGVIARARPAPPRVKKNSTKRAYKRREMRACFEGNALLALGVLVEEMVRAELKDAGYLALGGGATDGEREGAEGQEANGDGDGDADGEGNDDSDSSDDD
ncbi:uncharacterized protein LOC62_06G008025 [Vanrija pseudolonga]|uniref:Uncharacterized protein n=1 Tax=Vanrija pseudolonga TaxID=143232 RepID=A0AAF1BKD2_9TREE|nr:hypothetical protein LOC62_06G008025 [Vanrija pseudolonga]